MNLKNNQVLINVKYSAVTPSDVVRASSPGKSGDVYAGVIKSVGEDVKEFRVGDKVFGTVAPRTGAHQEQIVRNASSVISKIPKSITLEESASLVDGPLTAYAFSKKFARLRPGQNVLVNGASGSVGTAAVQIAKYIGANVTGVCSDKNIKLVKSLGADKVIDYNKHKLSEISEQFDVVFDTVNKSSFSEVKNILTPTGIYMTTGPSFAIVKDYIMTRFTKKKAIMGITGPFWKQQELVDIKDMVGAGKLKPIIDRRYDLSDLEKAYEYVKKGHKVGSVVIKVS